VSAVTVPEAAAAGIVAIAVPWSSVPTAVSGLQWHGQTVIDATNAWDAELGGRTSSELVADLVPGARLVKAANTLWAEVLGADPHEAGGRRVIFLSGDDAAAKASVVELFDAAGFFVIDVGDLVTGGRMQQQGGPVAALMVVGVGCSHMHKHHEEGEEGNEVKMKFSEVPPAGRASGRKQIVEARL